MSVQQSNRNSSPARLRAGDRKHARRADLKSVASCVVSKRRKCHETRLRCDAGASKGKRYYHRNQQYSVVALTNGSGAIQERYAYSAYGTPSITNAAGTARTTSAESNRYSYTGREFDEALDLYHYRARMYDSAVGRFCSRDPIGYEGSRYGLYEYVSGMALSAVDPWGLETVVAPGGPTTTPTHHPIPRGPTYPTNIPKLPPRPPVPPVVTGGVCRLVLTRVCAPVAVGYTSYKCGEITSTYTTVPVCEYVTRWWCSDDEDDISELTRDCLSSVNDRVEFCNGFADYRDRGQCFGHFLESETNWFGYCYSLP